MTSQELFKSITSKHDKMGKMVEMPTSGNLNPTIVANTFAHYLDEMREVKNTFGNWDVDLDMRNPMERDLALRAKNATSDIERELTMVAIYQYGKIMGKLNLGFSHLSPSLAKNIKKHGGFYMSFAA